MYNIILLSHSNLNIFVEIICKKEKEIETEMNSLLVDRASIPNPMLCRWGHPGRRCSDSIGWQVCFGERPSSLPTRTSAYLCTYASWPSPGCRSHIPVHGQRVSTGVSIQQKGRRIAIFKSGQHQYLPLMWINQNELSKDTSAIVTITGQIDAGV